MKKILIIEDDPDIVDLLEIHLKEISSSLIKAYDGADGLAKAISESPDLILLDISLPKMDGLEVCQKIRQLNMTMPVIMLTARTEEIDRVLGLEIGANDYITKPFSIRELTARIKATFRFRKMIEESIVPSTSTQLNFKALQIDVDKRKVLLNDNRIELSPKEFELLVLLASNPGKNYSRSQLLNLVWGYDFEGYEHTVNSHINRLRSKIESNMADPVYIKTSWGVGYFFNEEI